MRPLRNKLVTRRSGRYTVRMGGGNTIATRVAVALLIALLIGLIGGCNGSSKPYSQTKEGRRAAQAKETEATQAKIAATRRRLARAQQRAAAQRRAIVARRRKLAATQRRREQSTTTTSLPPPPAATPENDHAAIQRTVNQMNAAFLKSVTAGIAYSVAANYWVGAGVYTKAECVAFEAGAGAGVVRESLVVQPETFEPTPGWRDPVTGQTPSGRIYAVSVDQVQTLVTTGEQRHQSGVVHATVLPSGRAQLLLRCS